MAFLFSSDSPGEWLRGNLHTHTTNSDGKLSVEETIEKYGEAGYDFLAITDHFSFHPGGEHNGVILLPGIEYDLREADSSAAYHILGLNQKKEFSFPENPTAQKVIDAIRNAGGEAVVCHPYWLALNIEDLRPLKDYIAVEVFNKTCERISKALSSVHWDQMLEEGVGINAIAVDDCHRPQEFCHGWVTALCEDRSIEGVMSALRKGRFYSTQGPQIHDLSMKDGKLSVKCSPVKSISFISNFCFGQRFESGDHPLEFASWPIPDREGYVRIECIDDKGQTAWSNALRLRDLRAI